MSAANRTLVRRWIEQAYNKGNLRILDEVIASNYVRHDPPTGELPRGPEAERQVVSIYRGAMPDLRVKIEQILADGSLVTIRWTASGTQTRPLRELPATGRRVITPGISICRISRGKIVEHWTAWDSLGFMQQLGAIPVTAAAASGR